MTKRAIKVKGNDGKSAAKAEAPKKGPEVMGFRAAYMGASQPIRGHGHKLRPVVLDRVPGTFTERDDAFLKALHGQYGVKPFMRLDGDAGAMSRLIGHGYLKLVDGNLDERKAKFAVTAEAVKARLTKVTATPK